MERRQPCPLGFARYLSWWARLPTRDPVIVESSILDFLTQRATMWSVDRREVQGHNPRMKCLTHKDTEAIAICIHCGRALCESCATRWETGRFVCSPACGTASKQMEDFIAGTRHKAVRGARVTAHFLYGTAAVFGASAVFFYFDGVWQLTAFLGACSVGSALSGLSYIRVAKRNTERDLPQQRSGF